MVDTLPEQQREPRPHVSNAVFQMAQEHGAIYNRFIDICLSKRPSAVTQSAIEQLFEQAPRDLAGLYNYALGHFQEELEYNHALLETHRGDEPSYLLQQVINDEKITDDGIVANIPGDPLRYTEPIPGLAIVQVEHEQFDYLVERGVTGGDGDAVTLKAPSRQLPSFMIVRRRRLLRGIDEEGVNSSQVPTVRHEFHHFLWNFLERGGVVPEPQESSVERNRAMESVREELVAYILEGDSFVHTSAWDISYAKDRDLLSEISAVPQLVAAGKRVLAAKNIDPSVYVYPIMTSRSFKELIFKIEAFTPLEGEIDDLTLKSFYSLWQRSYGRYGEAIRSLMKVKQAHIPEKAMEDLIKKELTAQSGLNQGRKFFDDYYRQASNAARFAQDFGIPHRSEEMMEEVLSAETGLSREVVSEIVHNQQLRGAAEATPDLEQFVFQLFKPYRLSSETFATFQHILALEPKLKVVLDQLKERIITEEMRNHEEEIRGINPESKARMDEEMRAKVELFKSL